MKFLPGPVDALDAPNCQVRVREPIPGGANPVGLKEADLPVSKQVIATALPAPPSFVAAVYVRMIAGPFSDKDFAGWTGHIITLLRYGWLWI